MENQMLNLLKRTPAAIGVPTKGIEAALDKAENIMVEIDRLRSIMSGAEREVASTEAAIADARERLAAVEAEAAIQGIPASSEPIAKEVFEGLAKVEVLAARLRGLRAKSSALAKALKAANEAVAAEMKEYQRRVIAEYGAEFDEVLAGLVPLLKRGFCIANAFSDGAIVRALVGATLVNPVYSEGRPHMLQRGCVSIDGNQAEDLSQSWPRDIEIQAFHEGTLALRNRAAKIAAAAASE